MEKPYPPQPPHETEPPKKDTSWHNSVASFMSRHVRHVRAKKNEWVHVQRSNGGCSGGGGSGGWLSVVLLVAISFCCWLAYKVFMWLCDLLRNLIAGISQFLIAAMPFILLGIIVLAIGTWVVKYRR